MKTLSSFSALALTLTLITSSASAQISKIDPLLTQIGKQSQKKALKGLAAKAVTVDEEGNRLVDCFIDTYSDAKAQIVAERLKTVGGTARSVIGHIMTANIPLSQVGVIAAWPEVKYIEAPKPLVKKNDASRAITKVSDVQAGSSELDSIAYDGSGVVIGIVDTTRPDYQHADLEDVSGNTRILYYWDQSATGSGVSEIASSVGRECSKAQIDADSCTLAQGGSSGSHATHVAGIAAGGDTLYKGVAPGSDLVLVFASGITSVDSEGTFSTRVVDGANYVFAKAAALGKAAVVNLSLGTSIGAHDDTSSMETALNALVAGNTGRAIVNAAGNENFMSSDSGAATFGGIHAAVDVTSGADEAFELKVRSGSSLLSSYGGVVYLDAWLVAGSTCTVELDAFDVTHTRIVDMSPVAAGTASPVSAANAGSTITNAVDFSESVNANNGKQHAFASITFNTSSASVVQAPTFDIIFRGTCTGDVWIYPDANSVVSFTKNNVGLTQSQAYTYQAGDSARTITIPGTASKVITVGSFMGRASWTDRNGVTHLQTATPVSEATTFGATGGTVDAISLFSSLGPTADGRTKPDITAPGEPIVSSMSSNGSTSITEERIVDADHFKTEGTSMSAPHVAGTVALLFQRNADLTSDEVKAAITGHATTDANTGTSLPDNTWGYGKLNALEAMKSVTVGTNNTISPSASPGGGACSLQRDAELKGEWVVMMLFLFLTFSRQRIPSPPEGEG